MSPHAPDSASFLRLIRDLAEQLASVTIAAEILGVTMEYLCEYTLDEENHIDDLTEEEDDEDVNYN